MFFAKNNSKRNKPAVALPPLLAGVSAGTRASELWPAYLRWVSKVPGYFGKVLKTPLAVTEDFDLYCCHIRLGLPVGEPPIRGRFKALEASQIGYSSPSAPKTREKGVSGPAITRLRVKPLRRLRLIRKVVRQNGV